MGNSFFFQWEIDFIKWLQSIESPFLKGLATVSTMLGEEYLVIILIGMFYWCLHKDLGRRMLLAGLGTMAVGSVIKGFFMRRRPYFEDPGIICQRPPHPKLDQSNPMLQGWSFPSLHSSMSTAVCVTLAIRKKKTVFTLIAVIIPLLIGFSRPFLGVHYPTDVLCGWGLGMICAFGLNWIADRRSYRAAFLFLIIVSSTGFFFCRENDFYTAYGCMIGLLLGLMFEDRYVNFKMPRSFVSGILRLALGFVLFLAVASVLKFLVGGISVDEHLILYMILRMLRYAILTFLCAGVYPMLFGILGFLK